MSERVWSAAYRGGMTMWEAQESIVAFCARRLKRREGLRSWTVRRKARRVLDLGCGNGSNTRYFAKLGFEAHGVDISRSAIELGRAWLRSERVKARLAVGDSAALDYRDAFFDAVVSHGVLDHMLMADALKTAAEARRVLRPRGLFFLTLASTRASAFGKGKAVGKHTFILDDGAEKGLPQHYFDLAEVRRLLRGFKLLDVRRAETLYGPGLKSRHARWQVTAEKA